MIEVIDRIPMYPGRVRLIPVPGQENTYDMVRADEPIEPGTPINRALFLEFINELNAIRQQVDDKLFEISQRTRVGDLQVGTVFGLYENGILVPYIKISNSYALSSSVTATGRPLVVRKNCIVSDVMMNAGDTTYANCRVDTWLNNDYLSMFDEATQSVISSVNISVEGSSGSNSTISRGVFLLSALEYGTGYSSLGVKLSYFSSDARRIATLNGTPVNHWTREGRFEDNTYISTTGQAVEVQDASMVAGIRPAFTLPPDFEVTVGDPSTENVMATGEVI